MNFVIIATTDIDSVDFTQTKNTNKDTCATSRDGTQKIVKYLGDQPPSISAIAGVSQEYTAQEIRSIMNSEEWYVDPITGE